MPLETWDSLRKEIFTPLDNAESDFRLELMDEVNDEHTVDLAFEDGIHEIMKALFAKGKTLAVVPLK